MSEKYFKWRDNPDINFVLKCAQMDTLNRRQQLLFEKAVEKSEETVKERWQWTGKYNPLLVPVAELAKTMKKVKKTGMFPREIIVRTAVINTAEVLEFGKVQTLAEEQRVRISYFDD